MAYDPNEDKKVYVGTEFLNAIEQPFSNLGSWISTQAEDNPDKSTAKISDDLAVNLKNIINDPNKLNHYEKKSFKESYG